MTPGNYQNVCNCLYNNYLYRQTANFYLPSSLPPTFLPSLPPSLLACPKGLEWGGNGCDIITHPPTPLSSSPLPFLCHPLTVLLVLCTVASLAACRHYQTTEPGSRHSHWAHRTTAAHHHHNITPHNVTHTPALSPSSHVQDLYDPT